MTQEPSESDAPATAAQVRRSWSVMPPAERVENFKAIDAGHSDDFFLALSAHDQATLLLAMAANERRLWMRVLAPDDAADVIQDLPEEQRNEFLQMLDEPTRREVTALMAYAQDAAGGLMSPRFARLRPEMTVGEAIRYLQRQAQEKLETIYYAYVLDQSQVLLGVVSFRDLFAANPDRPLATVMHTEIVSAPETMNQREVAEIIAQRDLQALPVIDAGGRMKGIVTVDDIVDVVQRTATEDMQKVGGMEALDTPYMQTSLFAMIKKRGGWLSALFLGEMLTASAMGYYEDEIAHAVILALFVPLIISSGGNSGSQATTLIIRAMALGEVAVRDWWRIIHREVTAGFLLGCLLATIGLIRILAWQAIFHTYGEHYVRVAIVVALSLLGVVTWGTVAGSMLPFLIRRFGFDPASASAPFVATLVDVSGLMIYFNVAQLVLHGTLL
ncbi:MAG TPA: magnesium transporter [Polyangiales bacterium]|nr:magnesium transporter [Polyangiales bacterium]